MTDETPDTQQRFPAAGNTPPVKSESAAEGFPCYRIPAPPVPGKTAWSVSPWLPE